MQQSDITADIIAHAESWIVDGYIGEARYVAWNGSSPNLQAARIQLSPPWNSSNRDNDLALRTKALSADQHGITGKSKADLIAMLRFACAGELSVVSGNMKLAGAEKLETLGIYKHRLNIDQVLHRLHFEVAGEKPSPLSYAAQLALEDEVRVASHPFDGVPDLERWLSLRIGVDGSAASYIQVEVLPPAEILVRSCQIDSGKLIAEVALAEGADPRLLALGVNFLSGPNTVVKNRRQLGGSLTWSHHPQGYQVGRVEVDSGESFAALLMLAYNGRSACRYWVRDATKSPSSRYRQLAHFDPELKYLRTSLARNDAREFEKAVASLAYLMGLSTSMPVHSHTPDIVGMTPNGRHVLIECTLNIANFPVKHGKLVDRCNGFRRELGEVPQDSAVVGVLVCQAARDQVVFDQAELAQNRILLVTGEDLTDALNKVQVPQDIDALIDEALAKLPAHEW